MKRILLLPGIGDIHWVLLKLQSWLAAQGEEWAMPEVSIWDIDGRPRALEYLQMIPWLRVGGYVSAPLAGAQKVWFNKLYSRRNAGDVVFNFLGFDVLMGVNGNMRNGASFKHLLHGAAVNYKYGPVLTQDNFGQHQAKVGPYFVLCFSGNGMFTPAWTSCLSAKRIKAMLVELQGKFPGCRFLFTGSPWDAPFTEQCQVPGTENLVGKTTLPQFLSLLKHSLGYVGWCGGNSILAQHLGTPTVVWWSKSYFPRHDRHGWQTPAPLGERNQMVLEVEDYDPDTTPTMVATYLGVGVEGYRGHAC